MEGWGFHEIEVPADGSCFFTSIAMALNDSHETWAKNEILGKCILHHIERYEGIEEVTLSDITPKFVRYMAACAMDEVGLEMYNQEASLSKRKKFETMEDFAKHILKSRCWADQSILRSFMKALKYQFSIVVFDHDLGKPTYMPSEWTFRKELYTCLHIRNNHYTPIRLALDGETYGLCVSRRVIRNLMSSYPVDVDTKY